MLVFCSNHSHKIYHFCRQEHQTDGMTVGMSYNYNILDDY